MKFAVAAIPLFLASFSFCDAARAGMDDVCPIEPSLHHSMNAEISECSAAIHNSSGAMGLASPGNLPEVRARGYFDRGLLYHFMGKYDLAIADYTSAMGWQQDFSDAYEARGDAYEDLGQRDKAQADYQTAARMSAGDDATRCWVRAVRGRPLDRALADCNEAVKANPDDASILQSRCFVYYRMGNYSAAVVDCNAAEKHNRRDADSLYVGGLAKLRSGDTAGGNTDISAALDADYQIADRYALYGVTRELVDAAKSK